MCGTNILSITFSDKFGFFNSDITDNITEFTFLCPQTKHGTKVHGSLSSRDIEEEFTSNPESNISYSRGRFPYEMHLQSMKQVNVGTRKEREIRRRPAPFDYATRLPIKHGFPDIKYIYIFYYFMRIFLTLRGRGKGFWGG